MSPRRLMLTRSRYLLLQKTASLPATVLTERVRWTGSASWFRENVARIRPEHVMADLVDLIDNQRASLPYQSTQSPSNP